MTAPSTPPAAPDTAARLAHARHELRTPVNAIIGYSELLLEDADPGAQPDLCAGLARLQALGKQVQDLIGELLGPALLEADPHLDLAALEAPLRVRLLAPCQEARAVATDLRRAAGQPPPQTVQADLERIGSSADRLLALLDDPFGEAGAAPMLPAAGEPSETAGGMEASEGSETPAGPGGRVLVVDDNAANRDMLARGLVRQGHGFAQAEHGKQALEMLQAGGFDLVLLDIMMPEMDGFEVLARIKADPNLQHIPVIMISALDQIDAVVRCIEMGAEDYLPKPFNPVLLRARVGACLEKKRLRDQELEYLRNVATVTEAAAAVEMGAFEPESLADVARREDSLGRLARVFQSMAREVRAREQALRQQVQQLRIEIDQSRKERQVAEITETDYFQQLQQKADSLRRRTRPAPE
jgi:DNA-binding response OmpR family regulator